MDLPLQDSVHEEHDGLLVCVDLSSAASLAVLLDRISPSFIVRSGCDDYGSVADFFIDYLPHHLHQYLYHHELPSLIPSELGQ